MSRRRKRRLASEINVVPYIDVMLVLLIIFMVTAPLLTTGVDVDLPKAAAKPMDFGQKNQPVVLSVKQNGQMYLNVGRDTKQALSPAEVEADRGPGSSTPGRMRRWRYAATARATMARSCRPWCCCSALAPRRWAC